MFALALVTLTCWVCASIALPRKPRLGCEVAELVSSRLLGRHGRLLLLAWTMTVVAVVALLMSLTPQVGASVRDRRSGGETCNVASVGTTCYRALANGMWVAERVQPDGTRQTVATWLPDSR